MSNSIDIECVVQGGDTLGEVPLWCDRTKRLWWVDVRRAALQSFRPSDGQHRVVRMPEGMLLGSIALRESGGFVLAANTGIHFFDPQSGLPPELMFDPEPDVPTNRLNDGKCDRAGRFWVGSMSDVRREPTGQLYRIDPDLSCRAYLKDIVVPNAISWSLDNKTMFFADTHRQLIWAFDYDIDDGHLSNRRVFKDWTHQLGRPDGATVDAEGFIWNCMVATGELIRLSPDGRVDRTIQLPVTNPTCPAFGGANMDTLYVTSHSLRIPPERLAMQPFTGGLLALNVGVKGVSEPRFAG